MKAKSNPKITLILKKSRKKKYLYPSARKTKFFLANKAKSYLKKGFLITIKVVYGKGIDNFGKEVIFYNAGTYDKIEDLKWALRAFYYEYLND